jgi:hypothetical protein
MLSVRTSAFLLLVAGSTACTALLGATDVPDPAAGQDSGDPADVTVGKSDTGADSSSGAGSSSGGSSSGPAEASSGASDGAADGPPESSTASSSGSSGGSSSGTTDASHESSVDSSGDAPADASFDVEAASCGPLTSTSNCGACGVVCDTTTGAPSCVGTTCTYICNPGHLDCNAVNGPDTDGCECTTPTCCGTGCQTTHSDGLGHNFYDCSPLGTYNAQTAVEACQAYAMGVGGDPTACSSGYFCKMTDEEACYAPGGTGVTCWGYKGTTLGKVTDFSCPSGVSGTWN